MKIKSVQLSLPSKIVANDDILKSIQEHSQAETPKSELANILEKTKKYLELSGSQERHWRAPGEKPIDHIKIAFNAAIKEAGWDKKDIDLLIYVGVGRGFIEPGNSYLVAYTLGLDKAQCFDLLDACMSWTRALNIIYHFFKQNKYKRAAIVNAEFNTQEYLFPDLFKLKKIEQLYYTFPAFTIGEGATVTLLEKDEASENQWEFLFSSRPDLAELCTIPAAQFEVFTELSERIGKNGPYHFTSYGFDMHKQGYASLRELFLKLTVPKEKMNIIFPHASSKSAWEEGAQDVGVADKMYYIFPRTGNLVSASVPAGIALAIKDKKLKRGDVVVGWVGSAGMSFATFSFIF